MTTLLALVLTWAALDVAILWALTRWKQPDPPPPDVTVARIQRNGLIRFKEPKP